MCVHSAIGCVFVYLPSFTYKNAGSRSLAKWMRPVASGKVYFTSFPLLLHWFLAFGAKESSNGAALLGLRCGFRGFEFRGLTWFLLSRFFLFVDSQTSRAKGMSALATMMSYRAMFSALETLV